MAESSIRVFISYSHGDQACLEELKKHLASLRAEELVSEWTDREIAGGSEWNEEIQRQLHQADIILLLLSAEFMNSEYVRKFEMPAAIERHDKGLSVVIPIHLKLFDYSQKAPFAKLQSYPTNAKPVSAWHDRDEAYLTVVKGIRAVVERIMAEREREAQLKADEERQRLLKLEEARRSYRTKAKELLSDGIIDTAERDTLDELRDDLGLPPEDVKRIENEESAPYRKKDEAKEKYRKTLLKVIDEGPIDEKKRESLDLRMRDLGLNADDVKRIEAEILAKPAGHNEAAGQRAREESERARQQQLAEEQAQADRQSEAKQQEEAKQQAAAKRQATAKRQAEAKRQEEAEQQAEAERQAAAAERQAEARRQAAAKQQAEAKQRAEAAEQQAQVERQAAAEQQAEVERQAAAERQAEARRQTAAERQAEAQRQAAAAERQAEARRQAAAERQAEAQRQAAAAERQAEAQRQAAAERQAEAKRQAGATQREVKPEPAKPVVRYCINCGVALNPAFKFCIGCGKPSTFGR